jgi:hypothetical protein
MHCDPSDPSKRRISGKSARVIRSLSGIYLVDPDYEFVRLGAERDELDLTSTSNVEF